MRLDNYMRLSSAVLGLASVLFLSGCAWFNLEETKPEKARPVFTRPYSDSLDPFGGRDAERWADPDALW